MTDINKDLPPLTCPQIDRAISELEKVRHDNSQLRYGAWHIEERRKVLEAERDALQATNAELLEALKGFVEDYDISNPMRTGDYHTDCYCHRCRVDMARAAIAKAEGKL